MRQFLSHAPPMCNTNSIRKHAACAAYIVISSCEFKSEWRKRQSGANRPKKIPVPCQHRLHKLVIHHGGNTLRAFYFALIGTTQVLGAVLRPLR